MPTVNSPIAFADALDPADQLDYAIDFSSLITQSGETISSQQVVLSAAAVAAGVQINQPAAPAISSSGKALVVWFSVATGQQAAAAFDGDGTAYLLEASITTSQQRKVQRTFTIRIKQQ